LIADKLSQEIYLAADSMKAYLHVRSSTPITDSLVIKKEIQDILERVQQAKGLNASAGGLNR
jgi:hypothetical protein